MRERERDVGDAARAARRWRAERFTHRRSGTSAGSRRRQAATCAAGLRWSTQRPIGTIRPRVLRDRDELGRGRRSPRVRVAASAAAPRRRRGGRCRRSNDRLVVRGPARRCSSARRRSLSSAQPVQRAARIASSNSSKRPRPCSLARYMAASASRSSVGGAGVARAGHGDADAEPVTYTSSTPSGKGCRQASPRTLRPPPAASASRSSRSSTQHGELVAAQAGDACRARRSPRAAAAAPRSAASRPSGARASR